MLGWFWFWITTWAVSAIFFFGVAAIVIVKGFAELKAMYRGGAQTDRPLNSSPK